MAVEIEQDLQDNYRALVASGGSDWPAVIQAAEAHGAHDLAKWAAGEQRSAAVSEREQAPKSRRAPSGETA